jgi:membrane protein DedA with SNARE-associated domain
MEVALEQIAEWVFSHSYFAMFVGMLFWGPPVTAAAAFGAALNVFSAPVVFLLSVASSLAADAAYYIIGFWGRERLINKYGVRLGITRERLIWFEKTARQNVGKAITLVKIIPFLATPGLLMAGMARMPIKKYTWWCIIVTVPSSLFFLILGYYFGAACSIVERYMKIGGYFAVGSILFFIILAHIYKKSSRKIAEKLENAT